MCDLAHDGDEVDVVEHRQPGGHRVVLGQVAEEASGRDEAEGGRRVVAADRDRAGVGAQDRGDEPQERGLAAAVGADDGRDPRAERQLGDGEVEPPAEAQVDAVEPGDCGHRSSNRSRSRRRPTRTADAHAVTAIAAS